MPRPTRAERAWRRDAELAWKTRAVQVLGSFVRLPSHPWGPAAVANYYVHVPGWDASFPAHPFPGARQVVLTWPAGRPFSPRLWSRVWNQAHGFPNAGPPWTWDYRPDAGVILGEPFDLTGDAKGRLWLPEVNHHRDDLRYRAVQGLCEDGSVLTWDLLRNPHMLLGGGTGSGKALALDTPIPTPDGWTTMGWLRTGDRVFDDQGLPCTVTGATEVMEGHDCYEVIFSDGSTITADAEHRWLTWTHRARVSEARAQRRRPSGSPFGRDQTGQRVRPAVVTTEEIRASLHDGKHTNHAVPLAEPLQYPPAVQLVDPYVLGAWLGDGRSASAMLTGADPEVFDEIEAAGHRLGTPIPDRRGGPAVTRQLYDLQPSLRLLGVLGDKHIPRPYLRASVEQRRALLQGLMDTDGSITAGGHCEFASSNEVLAEQVTELVTGLGYKVVRRAREVRAGGRSYGLAWRVCWTPDDGQPVFRLPRKLECQAPKRARHQTVNRWRYIVEVRPRPSVPVRCITVDSPSRLYLAGRAMVPTHNTKTMHATLYHLLAADALQACVVLDWKRKDFTVFTRRAYDAGRCAGVTVAKPDLNPAGIPDRLDAMVARAEDVLSELGRRIRDSEDLPEGEDPYLDRIVLFVLDEAAATLQREANPPRDDKSPLADAVRARNAQRARLDYIVSQVTMLGRAYHVHAILGAQSPRKEFLSGEAMANVPHRIYLGQFQDVAEPVIMFGRDAPASPPPWPGYGVWRVVRPTADPSDPYLYVKAFWLPASALAEVLDDRLRPADGYIPADPEANGWAESPWTRAA